MHDFIRVLFTPTTPPLQPFPVLIGTLRQLYLTEEHNLSCSNITYQDEEGFDLFLIQTKVMRLLIQKGYTGFQTMSPFMCLIDLFSACSISQQLAYFRLPLIS